MSAVSFSRLSSAPPPLRELLEVEPDGSWTAWRSNGAVVGRFAGTSEEAALLVERARRAARDEPSPGDHDASMLDSATDTVEVDGMTVEVGHGDEPAGAWGEAFAAARALLSGAVDHPLAAIALAVDRAGAIRLEHRGAATLEIELGSAGIELTSLDPDGLQVETTRSAVDLGRVEAGPGWSVELPLEGAGAPAPAGGDVLVELSFVAVDEGVYVPMMLSARRPAG
jgi:hypothetical protein